MNKSSDLDIIKQLEKELGVTLKKVEMGEIEEKKGWYTDLHAYALDEEGRVKVLSLDSLRLSKPQIQLVSQLHFLEQASFKSTRLKDYSFLSSLTQLTSLDLRENPITNLPQEIVKKGIDAIRNFFKQVDEQGKAKLYEARLLLVGEPGAGKTTLLKKILNPSYQVPNKEEDPTLGIEINSEWDFAYSHEDMGSGNLFS